MLSHTEDTPNRCNNSKNQFKQSKINNYMISELENYVDEKFNKAAMNYFKQFSDVSKAKHCSHLLIDSSKDQINLLQNEIHFLRKELTVKNHLL